LCFEIYSSTFRSFPDEKAHNSPAAKIAKNVVRIFNFNMAA
jgi:hypothetical protein